MAADVLQATPFQGHRVVLRPFEAEDVPALHACLNHPALMGRRYLPDEFPDLPPLPRKQAVQVVARWSEEKKGLHLAVVRREAGELLGHAGCRWRWDPHAPSVWLVVAPPSGDRERGYS